MAKTSAKNGIVLVGGYSISTYANQYTIDYGTRIIDVTGFTDGWQNFIPGDFTGQMAINFFWDNTNPSAAALKTITASKVASIIPQGYTLGNYAMTMEAMQANFTPGGATDGALMAGNIVFQANGVDGGPLPAQALAHGTITTTTTGTGFDDDTGAAVTQRCAGVLHIWTACASDTYVVKIQHSTALGSGYADLVTFTLNGSAIGAEKVEVASGTVNRYRRVLATRTGAAGDDFGFSCLFWHAGM